MSENFAISQVAKVSDKKNLYKFFNFNKYFLIPE